MKELESLWQSTKGQFEKYEKSLVDCYIAFLRDVAKTYLGQSRRVFFRENQYVNWGEWNFGSLIIEGDEKVDEVFGDYISEISFEPEIRERQTEEYMEIKKSNLENIRYEIRS